MAEEIAPGLLLTVRLSLPRALADDVVAEMASLPGDEAISISWEKTKNSWDILWLLDYQPNTKKLAKDLSKFSPVAPADLLVEPVKEVNWLEESYRQFPPFKVKKFFVHGSHYDGAVPTGYMPLQIDAATAFGSGEHGTTYGCLEALQILHAGGFKPRRILDMGAGSGILAIAAYKLWKKPTLAVDNDREATRVACRHRSANGVPSGDKGLTCATGDGYKARRVQQSEKFDLVIANILAGPLIAMAPEMERVLSRNGRVILSGLLQTQESEVLAAHKAVGLKKVKAIHHDEWSTLILQRAA